MSVYITKHRTQTVEEECRRAIEKSVDTLVGVKNLQAELYDCESFDEELDHEVRNTCEELLHSIGLLKKHTLLLEGHTAELFEGLGFSVGWDEKREEWYLGENFDKVGKGHIME
jgi:hypothetical protein